MLIFRGVQILTLSTVFENLLSPGEDLHQVLSQVGKPRKSSEVLKNFQKITSLIFICTGLLISKYCKVLDCHILSFLKILPKATGSTSVQLGKRQSGQGISWFVQSIFLARSIILSGHAGQWSKQMVKRHRGISNVFLLFGQISWKNILLLWEFHLRSNFLTKREQLRQRALKILTMRKLAKLSKLTSAMAILVFQRLSALRPKTFSQQGKGSPRNPEMQQQQ